MKYKQLMAALENYDEQPLAESVVAVAEGNVVDPQIVTDVNAPVNEPATIPDAGEMPLGVPAVSPLPIIEEPVVAEVVPTVPEVSADLSPVELGGTELVIESPIDHDNTMELMDRTVVEETELRNDLGEMVETQVALEAYAKLLRQAGPDGITRQAAGFLRVGLEQFHNDGHIDLSREIASMEDMGEGDKQHLLPSKIKGGGLAGKLKEIAAKIWEWLKKTWDKAKTFVDQLRNGVVQLERKIKKIGRALEGSMTPPQGEFEIPNPDRIAVGDKVEINFPNSMKAVTLLATKVYPERMTQFYTAIANTLANFDVASGDASEINETLDKAADVLRDIAESEQVLPGNVKIEVGGDGLSYGIAEGSSYYAGREKNAVSGETAQARSGNTIMQQVKELQVVLNELKAYPERHEKMAAAAAKVGQALERIKSASSGENMEEGASKTAEAFESKVGQLLHKANPRGNEIIRYLARTTSAFADVIIAELKLSGKDDNDKAVATT